MYSIVTTQTQFYVQIAVRGRYGLERTRQLLQVSEVEATANNRQRVLIDMRRVLGRLDVAERFSLGAALAKLVRLKTALLATPEILGAHRPQDPIVQTEGVVVRTFQSEAAAIGWLTRDATATTVSVPATRISHAGSAGSLRRRRGN